MAPCDGRSRWTSGWLARKSRGKQMPDATIRKPSRRAVGRVDRRGAPCKPAPRRADRRAIQRRQRKQRGPREEDAEPGGGPHQRAVPEQLQLQHRPGEAERLDSERPAGDPDQADGRLEPHHADHRAHHQPAAAGPRRGSGHRHGRHQPERLPLAVRLEGVHLGHRPDVHVPDGEQPAARHGQVERGTGGRGAHDAGPLGGRRADQQPVVVRRLGTHPGERSCSSSRS